MQPFSGYIPSPPAVNAQPCAQFIDACHVLQSPRDFRFATLSTQGAHRPNEVLWLFKRPCSLTPAQLAWTYVSLCVVSLAIAGFFWSQGATLVMPFAGVELLAVGIAFLAYARHAGDAEKIILQSGQLVVEQEMAGRTLRAEFNREWVRVEPRDGDGSLIEVSGQGRSVRVGRHVRPELRPALAREIRSALLSS
ncbi:MAG: DUF2244 domain-containing protein [Polaromonas sp.]|nr:DUF2244 domain-containing protein [Polaromonas sp.]